MIRKKNILFLFTFLFVISLFSYLFYLSTNYIINYWSFSQSHLNYSHGFVKRGLFGSIALFLEKILTIKFTFLFTYFFIIVSSVNIILYFTLIKKYSFDILIFLFIALSPTLILFPFNDLGGYQRFDSFSIFILLLHTYYVCSFRSGKINFDNYKKKFTYLIFPLIIISIFIHEIQCWLIPIHFFMIKMIYEEKNKTFVKIYSIFIIIFFISIFVFFYPVKDKNIILMLNELSNKNLWIDAITVASSSKGNLGVLNYELSTNLFNLYNFKINIFFLLMSIFPINFLIFYLNKKGLIHIKNKNTYKYFYFSIIPLFVFFAIGDTGRWIHLISMICLCFLLQFVILKNKSIEKKNSLLYLRGLLLLILIIYIFFVRLPHGGNLEAKSINIWGGIFKKFEAIYMIYLKENTDEKFDLNKRFNRNNDN